VESFRIREGDRAIETETESRKMMKKRGKRRRRKKDETEGKIEGASNVKWWHCRWFDG
jgi:hypothetical protein